MKMAWLALLLPAAAAAGPWEAGNCGINMSCQVGPLTATTGAFSGALTATDLNISGASTLVGPVSCGPLAPSSVDAGTVRVITAETIDGTLGVGGTSTFAAVSAGNIVANSVDAGYVRNTGALTQVGQVTALAGSTWQGTVSSGGTNVFAPGGNSYAGFSSSAALAMAGAMSGNPTIYYLGGAGNGGVDVLIQDAGTIGLGANLKVTATGGLLGTGTDLGLLQVDTTDTACTTVCPSVDAGTCFLGQNLAALTYKLVACSSATADNCICLGHPP